MRITKVLFFILFFFSCKSITVYLSTYTPSDVEELKADGDLETLYLVAKDESQPIYSRERAVIDIGKADLPYSLKYLKKVLTNVSEDRLKLSAIYAMRYVHSDKVIGTLKECLSRFKGRRAYEIMIIDTLLVIGSKDAIKLIKSYRTRDAIVRQFIENGLVGIGIKGKN